MIEELKLREKLHEARADKHFHKAMEYREKAQDSKTSELTYEYTKMSDNEWSLFDMEMAIVRELQDIIEGLVNTL